MYSRSVRRRKIQGKTEVSFGIDEEPVFKRVINRLAIPIKSIDKRIPSCAGLVITKEKEVVRET